MQSFLWSFILARTRILLYFLYTFLAYKYKDNLVIIVIKQIIIKNQEKCYIISIN